MKKRITLINKVEELTTLAGQIDELAEQWELPMPLVMNLNLVLEETVSNIIFYAFPDGQEHSIDVQLSLDEGEITIEIIDEGIPFDPTVTQQPNINLPAEDRPIGGLGIFLVSKIMDSVSYCREQGKNILTLKKKL